MVLRRLIIVLSVLGCVAPLLVACGSQRSSEPMVVAPGSPSKDQPIRASEEHACLNGGAVRESPYIQRRSALGGPGRCGSFRPFNVEAVDRGRVALQPAALLRCPMVPAVDRWVQEVVVPASVHYLGSPVKALRIMASYSCRTRNSLPFAKLSEHGLANAIDIGAFDLADGRRITVLRGWRRGSSAEQAFLRAVHRDACRYFTTVLGPEADKYHQNHFHFDLARHNKNNSYRHCR